MDKVERPRDGNCPGCGNGPEHRWTNPRSGKTTCGWCGYNPETGQQAALEPAEAKMSNPQAELLGFVCSLHTAWMRREELMRASDGGFESMEQMADLLDQVFDGVPKLMRLTELAVGEAALEPLAERGREADLEQALRNIAEGNLGDMPWQANYDRIREVALAALREPSNAHAIVEKRA